MKGMLKVGEYFSIMIKYNSIIDQIQSYIWHYLNTGTYYPVYCKLIYNR